MKKFVVGFLILTSLVSLPVLAMAKSYVNVNGVSVSSPVHQQFVPYGATAQCRDGSYSFSLHRSGTCSHHGGVKIWEY